MVITTASIGTIFTVFSTLLFRKLRRMDNKADSRHEGNIKREVLMCRHRRDESVLLFSVVEAVQSGRINGELEKAKDQYEKTNKEYDEFVRVQAGTQLAR